MRRIPISYHTSHRPENAKQTIETLLACERAQVPKAWLGALPFGVDPLAIIPVVAERTTNIHLGTGIVTTYPRHPAILANQALTIAELYPDRLHLGLGCGHKPVIEGMYGLEYGKPLAHMREYITVLRALMWEGGVDYSGEYYRVQGRLVMGDRDLTLEEVLEQDEAFLDGAAETSRVPLPIAAVQRGMFRLAGEVADGAMSAWCPLSYLQEIALPAMREGAEAAGRPVPALIGQVPVVFNTDFDRVRQAIYNALRMALSVPTPYARIWKLVGFELNADGLPPDEFIHEMIAWGNGRAIGDRVEELHQAGIDEIMIDVHSVSDPIAEETAVINLIGELAGS
jgi:alkanesulfonate monooxygenase SsuD/methylene tetrahydromethanopterin reductase-like flavin-dependent oxidoreductase (luciferase family)